MAETTTKTIVTKEMLAYYNTKNQEWVKAEDEKVLAAAKEHAESLADNYDPAGTASTKATEAETAAKAYADEKVAAEKERAEGIEADLEERLADVETALGTGEGSVEEKIANAKQEAIDAAAEDATTKANAVDGKLAAEVTRATEAEAANKALAEAAQAAADKAQEEVDNLEKVVGTLPEGATDVITYVDAQVAAEKTRAEAAEQAIDEKADANATDIDKIEANVGSVDSLSTTNKTVVGAINEVLAAVGTGGTAAVVTVTTDTTTEGAVKSYTIKQGTTTVGVIDIPKDMVVESGEVVTNPEGQDEGTYIKLVLANVAEPLYVNVGTLVDIYKAKESAAQVQIAIDSATREISASIVAESITATELATDAVTTAKIADANVTKAKLSTEVQASLDKADNAETNAKAYVDAEVDKVEAVIGTVAEGQTVAGLVSANATAIAENDTELADHEERLAALESVEYVEMTSADVDAMFAEEETA